MGVGILAEQGLRARGYDVLAVRDLDPAMPDEDILLLAERGAHGCDNGQRLW